LTHDIPAKSKPKVNTEITVPADQANDHSNGVSNVVDNSADFLS